MENDREQEAKGEDVKKSESKDPPKRPEPIVFVGKMVSCIYERSRYKVKGTSIRKNCIPYQSQKSMKKLCYS